jgi:hypothetical protein
MPPNEAGGTYQCSQIRRLFPARHQQTALMGRLAQPLEQAAVPLVPLEVRRHGFAGAQDRLPVVQHQQTGTLAQQVEQEQQAPIRACRHRGLPIGEEADRVGDPLLERQRVAEAAPEHVREPRGQILDETSRHAGLPDAAQAEDRDHPALLVQHPRSKRLQLVGPALETGHVRRLTPVQVTRSLMGGHPWRGRHREGNYGRLACRPCAPRIGEQPREPDLVERRFAAT